MTLSRRTIADPETRPPTVLLSDEALSSPATYRVVWCLTPNGPVQQRDVQAASTQAALARVRGKRRPAWAFAALKQHFGEGR